MVLCDRKNTDQQMLKQEISLLLRERFGLSSLTDGENSESYVRQETIIALTPCEMVYFIYFLENKYDIMFAEADFSDPTIYTISGLTHIIKQHIGQREKGKNMG